MANPRVNGKEILPRPISTKAAGTSDARWKPLVHPWDGKPLLWYLKLNTLTTRYASLTGPKGGARYFQEATIAHLSDEFAVPSIETGAARDAIVTEKVEVGGCNTAGVAAAVEGMRAREGGGFQR